MRPSFSSSAATPVPVVIGGTAIIATRIIGVLLLVAELGFSGVSDFISDSLQRWDTGLIFFASIVLLLLDMMCGVAVCHRRNWARWYYLICQLIIMIYLLMASLNWLEPDIFRIEGDSGAEILHSLLLQKSPTW